MKRPKINEKEAGIGPLFKKRAVVVAQLIEEIFPTPEVLSSNPVISNFYFPSTVGTEKTIISKRGRQWTIKRLE